MHGIQITHNAPAPSLLHVCPVSTSVNPKSPKHFAHNISALHFLLHYLHNLNFHKSSLITSDTRTLITPTAASSPHHSSIRLISHSRPVPSSHSSHHPLPPAPTRRERVPWDAVSQTSRHQPLSPTIPSGSSCRCLPIPVPTLSPAPTFPLCAFDGRHLGVITANDPRRPSRGGGANGQRTQV